MGLLSRTYPVNTWAMPRLMYAVSADSSRKKTTEQWLCDRESQEYKGLLKLKLSAFLTAA